MLQEAFEYPRRGEHSLRTILVGGACILFSFLLVPAVLLQGYVLRVLRRGGDGDPPTFDDPAGLLVDGLKAFVVQFVYVAVPTLLMLVVPAVLGAFVLSLGSTAGSGSGGGGGVVGVVGALVALVFVPLLLAVLLGAVYLLPAALALLAREGRIAAAFDPSGLRRVAFTREYLVGFLLYLAVSVVGGMVGSALVFALLLGVFVLFYAQVSAYFIVARSVDDALARA